VRAVVVSRAYADPANRGKLRALAALGAEVAAAVPDRWTSPGDGARHRTKLEHDAGVLVMPVAIRGRARDPRWAAKPLRRVLNEFRPDVVQIEEEPWTRAAALPARLARRLRAPAVLVPRDSLAPPLGLVRRFRRDRTLAAVRGVIAASQAAAALARRGRPDLPGLVLPPFGVPLPAEAPRDPHPGFSIGFAGRLVPERGLDVLLRACVAVVGDWRLTVIGTGPAQEELEALAERLGIAARLHWLGALPRPAGDAVWRALDCLVAPSRTTPRWVDGAGRAALDAMAHGVAVVGTNSGVLPEILGEAGVVVPEDDVPALTAALQRLCDDRAACHALGAAGRRRANEEFSEAAVARRTLAFWHHLTQDTRAAN
jgi:glycosyltransferase involved in cell wall biosynthesis